MNLVDKLVVKKKLRSYNHDTLFTPKMIKEAFQELKEDIEEGEINKRNALHVILNIRTSTLSIEDKDFIECCCSTLECCYSYGRNILLSCNKQDCLRKMSLKQLKNESYKENKMHEACYECWSFYLYLNDIVETDISYKDYKNSFRKKGLIHKIRYLIEDVLF